ncbi:MAG: hypothetical protein UHD64_00625 [Bacteroidales bacterium]|nr:hypothetical protein [Bacteroidales bacterium]
MMYKQIECPTCGNTTTAKSTPEVQKCRWCRRLFKATVTRRNKEGKKGKFDWTIEPVDFPDDDKSRIQSVDDYIYEDIYGKSKR